MQFRSATIKDKTIVDGYLKSYTSLASDIDFSTGFVWNVNGGFKVAEHDDTLFMCNDYFDRQLFFAPPITRDPRRDLTPALTRLRKYCADNNLKFIVSGVSGDFLARVDEGFLNEVRVTYNRDFAEYVYETRDLIELNRTKPLRDKLNRIHKFKNRYIWNFRDYRQNDRESLFRLYADWENTVNHESSDERKALVIALDNLEQLGMRCGVLEIDGVVRAFAIGGEMYQGMPHIMFEKADTSFYGIYQAINQFFAEKYLCEYKYVNRQEDLGIEGLRRAKMSYEPCFLVEKYWLGK